VARTGTAIHGLVTVVTAASTASVVAFAAYLLDDAAAPTPGVERETAVAERSAAAPVRPRADPAAAEAREAAQLAVAEVRRLEQRLNRLDAHLEEVYRRLDQLIESQSAAADDSTAGHDDEAGPASHRSGAPTPETDGAPPVPGPDGAAKRAIEEEPRRLEASARREVAQRRRERIRAAVDELAPAYADWTVDKLSLPAQMRDPIANRVREFTLAVADVDFHAAAEEWHEPTRTQRIDRLVEETQGALIADGLSTEQARQVMEIARSAPAKAAYAEEK
jgi:hypothetical protein